MKPLHLLRLLSLLAGACGAAPLCGCDSSAKTVPRAVSPPDRRVVTAVEAAPRAELRLAQRTPVVAASLADGSITNVFAATSWQPTVAPLPAPSARPPSEPVAPPPAAPPMPFRFIGRYGDADSQIVMLVKDDRLYLVAVGETIDDVYRVDRVSGTMVELTYLPLNLKQSLSTGGAG
jgi:hypothetical protein